MKDKLLSLFKSNNIPSDTSGPNWIVIRCPLCTDDPSMHMNINIHTGSWHCWRSDTHRGRFINKLLKILGLPTLTDKTLPDPDALEAIASGSFFEENTAEISKEVPKRPVNFSLIGDKMLDEPYRKYLMSRGFDESDISILIARYGLMRDTDLISPWSDRIIFTFEQHGIPAWTGRSIWPIDKRLRYLSPSGSVLNIKDFVFNYDNLWHSPGKILLVTEGPFDALKVDYYGWEFGIRATCLFGVQISDAQLDRIKELAALYEIFIAFDSDATLEALKLNLRLPGSTLFPLSGYKDFGEIPKEEIKNILRRIVA